MMALPPPHRCSGSVTTMSATLDELAARNADVVQRYLSIFETGAVGDLAAVVAHDVNIHGASSHVSGREHVESAVVTPGLSHCRVRVEDLFSAGDRVVVAFTLTYRHDASGRDVVMSGVKSYRLKDGLIVEFWGETDLYGLLRQLGVVPDQVPAF
jgi:ketosteroid isomerase-like protein